MGDYNPVPADAWKGDSVTLNEDKSFKANGIKLSLVFFTED